jgi:hypothetical protein
MQLAEGHDPFVIELEQYDLQELISTYFKTPNCHVPFTFCQFHIQVIAWKFVSIY